MMSYVAPVPPPTVGLTFLESPESILNRSWMCECDSFGTMVSFKWSCDHLWKKGKENALLHRLWLNGRGMAAGLTTRGRKAGVTRSELSRKSFRIYQTPPFAKCWKPRTRWVGVWGTRRQYKMINDKMDLIKIVLFFNFLRHWPSFQKFRNSETFSSFQRHSS